MAGKDPDFHRRDLFDSIEKGDFPEWQLGFQIVPESDEFKFDFDLLDPTKIIPEEQVPITFVGRLVLNRNPDNYFAETEQVAFHLGHVVPGIDFSNDPLLQGRLFSYMDTQIKRIGPNFAQLPINRPTCPFSNNQRDGEGQQMIFKGKVAYFPNSLANGTPAHSPDSPRAFTSYPERIDAEKIRKRSDSFSDHFGQARLFWNSMADWEKAHIIAALSFELNMVESSMVKQRVIDELLINVDHELATKVATNIDLKVTKKPVGKFHNRSSPALSMNKPCDSIKGRKVAILAGNGVDAALLEAVKKGLEAQGAIADVIARSAGSIKGSDGSTIPVAKPAANAASVMYDAVFLPSGAHTEAAAKLGLNLHFVAEAFAHGKPIAAVGPAADLLPKANVPVTTKVSALTSEEGVIIAPANSKPMAVLQALIDAMKQHRFFHRSVDGVPA